MIKCKWKSLATFKCTLGMFHSCNFVVGIAAGFDVHIFLTINAVICGCGILLLLCMPYHIDYAKQLMFTCRLTAASVASKLCFLCRKNMKPSTRSILRQVMSFYFPHHQHKNDEVENLWAPKRYANPPATQTRMCGKWNIKINIISAPAYVWRDIRTCDFFSLHFYLYTSVSFSFSCLFAGI